jgi:hypothetical protein
VSAWSQAYHAMQPRDLEFCHNWALRSSFYCAPGGALDDYGFPFHFAQFGLAWSGATGADVAHSNLNVNYFLFGDCQNRPMVLFTAGTGFLEDDEPARSPYGDWPYYPQFEWIPALAYNYPAPPRRARRTYWTGAPRRRLNLPA